MPGDGPRDYEPQFPTPKFNWPKVGAIAVVVICGVALLVALIPRARNFFIGYQITVSQPSVSGSFFFHPVLGGQPWDGLGGACIVGDFAKLVPATDPYASETFAGSCTVDAQCNPKGDDQKRGGYCIQSPKEGGRCWYKPVEEETAELVCRRSIDYDPPKTWTAGVHYPVPDPNQVARFNVHDFYRDHTGGKSTQWLLIGLLKNDSGQHPVYGTPATLP
jgi:hypothetical protein